MLHKLLEHEFSCFGAESSFSHDIQEKYEFGQLGLEPCICILALTWSLPEYFLNYWNTLQQSWLKKW